MKIHNSKYKIKNSGNLVKAILYTAVYIFTFFNVSCDDLVYSPDEKHYVQIEQPQTSISISLNSTDDTLYINGTTKFDYSIDVKDKEFARVEFYIDNIEAGYSTNNTSYVFYPKNFTSGYHVLKMEVWAYSASGSLADKLHSEFIVNSEKWNIVIDNQPDNQALKIDSVYAVDGTLRIQWKKYPYYNYENCQVYKSVIYNEGYTGEFKLIATILDKKINYFDDHSFIGGAAKYKITLKNYNYSINSPEKTFSDSSFKLLSVTPLDNEKVEVKWNKSKYYSNFKKYILKKAAGYGYYNNQYDEEITFNNYTDTTTIFSPGFGDEVYLHVDVYSNDLFYTSSNIKSVVLGKRLNNIYEINSFQYIPNLNSIYINGEYRFDANSLVELAKGTGKIVVSKNGNIAFTNEKPGFDPAHTFTRIDPLSLLKGETFTTDQLMNYYSTIDYYIVSESGVCFYMGYKYIAPSLYGRQTKFLIDTEPPKVLYKDSSSNYTDLIRISNLSDEGEYIIAGTKLYNLKSKNLNDLHTINISYINNYYPQITFLKTGKEFVVSEDLSLKIYRCSDNSLVKSFDAGTNLGNLMIDESTGYLGGNEIDGYRYKIYDLTDGKLIKEIKLVYSTKCYLANSFLFSKGYYIKLNLN